MKIFLVANQHFNIAPQLDRGEFNDKDTTLMCHDFIEDGIFTSRAYRECTKLATTRTALDAFLEEYNGAFPGDGKLELVFFFDAMATLRGSVVS